MNRTYTLCLIVLSAIMLMMIVAGNIIGNNVNIVYAKCNLPGKHHDNNNPSDKKFKKQNDICELAKCVDSMKCDSREKLSKDQFMKIFDSANQKQRVCLLEVQHHGVGRDGVVGYEIQYCINDKN